MIDDKKYIGGSFYDWALADKDNPLPLYYCIKYEDKVRAEFFDSIWISPLLMTAIRRAVLEDVEYETKYIAVTIRLSTIDFNDCFLELENLRCGYDINKNRIKKLKKKGA